MSVNKCPWCGGKFGLVRHYHSVPAFAAKNAAANTKLPGSVRNSFADLSSVPLPVWLETDNASTRSDLSAVPRQVNCPFSNEGASVIYNFASSTTTRRCGILWISCSAPRTLM